MNILYVTSSPRGEASYSTQVGQRAIDEIRQHNPDATVTVRDLARDPLPHIDEDFVTATRTQGPLTERQRSLLGRSDALVDELLAADIIVIAAAMINFGVPSTLKTWIDYVCRAGRTFRYGKGGPQGLVTGKHAVLVVARGGVYSEANKASDFQLPYLVNVLAFLGLTDVNVIEVEGTAFGPEAAGKAVEAAAHRMHQRCAEATA